MVTVMRKLDNDVWVNEVRCLSTDTKPTDKIRNGSILIEIDTGEMYMFDKTNSVWYKI